MVVLVSSPIFAAAADRTFAGAEGAADDPAREAPGPSARQAGDGGTARGGRIGPPASIDCPRNHLTGFMGTVLSYKRSPERIALRVRTDEATTESATLKFGKEEGPVRWLLLHGQPFKPEDWVRIESGPGRLLDGMRVMVWLCDDGRKPVFDWRPIEEPREEPSAPPPG